MRREEEEEEWGRATTSFLPTGIPLRCIRGDKPDGESNKERARRGRATPGSCQPPPRQMCTPKRTQIRAEVLLASQIHPPGNVPMYFPWATRSLPFNLHQPLVCPFLPAPSREPVLQAGPDTAPQPGEGPGDMSPPTKNDDRGGTEVTATLQPLGQAGNAACPKLPPLWGSTTKISFPFSHPI